MEKLVVENLVDIENKNSGKLNNWHRKFLKKKMNMWTKWKLTNISIDKWIITSTPI